VRKWLATSKCVGWPITGSVDLVFCSPPYESARLYLENGKDLNIARDTESWVSWMVECFRECLRVCNGLVAFVVEGQTRNFRYSCGPALLMADLHRAGVHLRKPPIFHRIGIPGSGGPDWLRNDYEFIVCATNGGKLPWSDNTACGHTPKWDLGGAMSYRNAECARANESHGPKFKKRLLSRGKHPDGTLKKRKSFDHAEDGSVKGGHERGIAAISNPGNSIERVYTAAEISDLLKEHGDWRHHIVGGGVMGGDQWASQNEAPFPEKLAEFFILSFCKPGGTVLDPFSGSGTTAAVALRHGRNAIGIDLRQSMVELARSRCEAETPMGLFA
jgi:hypothetical protein